MKKNAIKRFIRGLAHLLGGIGAGLAIMMVISAWKLSHGPISLAFLSPYIERTLASFHKSFRIRLDDTILTWAGWERTLDIRVINVRILGEGEALIASVPELSLSLSAKALVRGMVAPKSIELFRPSLKVVRHRDGSLEVGFNSESVKSDEFVQRMFALLMQKPDPTQPVGFLSKVRIFDADLKVIDQTLQTSWSAPRAQIQLYRGSNGIKGDMNLNLLVGDSESNVSVIGEYLENERRFDFGIEFDKVMPSALAKLSPDLSLFSSVEVPLQGTLTFSLLGDGTLESIGLDVLGSKGAISLPVKFAEKYGILSLAQRVHLKEFNFRGRYDGYDEKIEISNLTLDFGSSGKIYLPTPFDHEMPIKTLSARGRYIGGESRFEFDAVELDLNGPEASIALNLDTHDDGLSIGASGVVRSFNVDYFPSHWPRGLASKARSWVIKHILDGEVLEARASLQANYTENNGFELLTIDGDMNIRGATVQYLTPMPEVSDITATARFNKKEFDIFISNAETQALKTRKSIISFRGLDQIDQYAHLDLFVKGPLYNALSLIEHEPLGLASAIGISPEKAKGEINGHLQLNFLVEDSLTTNEIDFSLNADLFDVSVENIILGLGIQDGQLGLKISKQGLDLSGDVKLGNIPASLEWRGNFGGEVPYRGRYKINSSIEKIRNLEDLGINTGQIQGNFIEGGVSIDLQLTTHDDGKGQVQALIDLDDALLKVPALGWSKKIGVDGKARVEIEIHNDRLIGIPNFYLAAGDMRINGSASYANDGTGLEKIDISQISLNKTDIAGVVTPGEDGGWTVSFHGPSLNLEPLFEDLFKNPQEDDDDSGLELSLSVKVDKVWLGDKHFLKQITGTLNRANKHWRGMNVDGFLSSGEKFAVLLRPNGKGQRVVTIKTTDAGNMLRSFDVYDTMIGGLLEVSATFDDTAEDHPLSGEVIISDYRLVDAPALARLVDDMTLTNLKESLQGDGLAFSEFRAPFVMKKGVIDIEDVKATGLSLGYTAKGKIYSHAEIVDIEGTVVPAYALNSVLGNIPIIGTLLTGVEEGGGIFAATYKMSGPLEDPKVKVNPLSVLTPGIFRNLFGILTDDKTLDTQNADTDKSNAKEIFGKTKGL